MDADLHDALAIFGLRWGGFDDKTLKKAFMSEAMRLHPDRGGSNEQYIRLEIAYKYLKKELRKLMPTPSHRDMQKASMEARVASHEARRDRIARGGIMLFNQEFEQESRLHVRKDAEDGYSEWLQQSVPEASKLKDFSQFNARFADEAKKRSTSLIVRQGPISPAAACTLSPALSDETEGTSDYSSVTSAVTKTPLAFTDLRVAHEAQLMDPEEVHKYSQKKEAQLLKLLKESTAKEPTAKEARKSRKKVAA